MQSRKSKRVKPQRVRTKRAVGKHTHTKRTVVHRKGVHETVGGAWHQLGRLQVFMQVVDMARGLKAGGTQAHGHACRLALVGMIDCGALTFSIICTVMPHHQDAQTELFNA